MEPFLSDVGFMSMFSVLLLPLAVIQLFALIFIPSMLVPGAKPMAVGKAVYAYTMQTVGIILMVAGAFPALYGVLQKLVYPEELYTTEIYIALLVLFATGGLLFLWHEQMAQTVDEMSRRVTDALFWFFWRAVGTLSVIVAVLSLLLTMLLTPQPLEPGWWIMSTLILAFGWLLCYATRLPKAAVMRSGSPFTPRPPAPTMIAQHAGHAKTKPAAKKKK